MIPNIFHFVFGLEKNADGKPFSLAHYLAIKSASEVNNPETILFHHQYEPEGECWQKAKPLLTLNKVEAPSKFMGRPIYHVAHKADVIRLQALRDTGGIYLDMDTICVKPITGLLSEKFVIGKELNLPYVPKNSRQRIKLAMKKKLGLAKKLLSPEDNLCNAVLMSEKNSEFINLWINEYSSFRSKGRDKYWNEHSGRVPRRLAALHPELVSLQSPYAFHYPLYNEAGMRSMFEEVTEFPDAYLHHLWESFSWEKYLSRLTEKDIFERDTTYNCIARRFL
jgi:hypothetical protein